MLPLTQAWFIWVATINLCGVFFLQFREGQVVPAAFVVVLVSMCILIERKGFNKLRGLPSVIVWLPLVVWLFPRIRILVNLNPFQCWLFLIFLTNSIFLIVSIKELTDYFNGDRC